MRLHRNRWNRASRRAWPTTCYATGWHAAQRSRSTRPSNRRLRSTTNWRKGGDDNRPFSLPSEDDNLFSLPRVNQLDTSKQVRSVGRVPEQVVLREDADL